MSMSTIARRSTFLTTTISRTTTRLANSTPRRVFALPRPSIPSNPSFSHPPRLLRRELSSLVPVHSTIASARLVSKLPTGVTSSSEGRFINYVSPI